MGLFKYIYIYIYIYNADVNVLYHYTIIYFTIILLLYSHIYTCWYSSISCTHFNCLMRNNIAEVSKKDLHLIWETREIIQKW